MDQQRGHRYSGLAGSNPSAIGAGEIYNEVIKLSGKVEVVISQQETLKEDVKDNHRDFETRLRSLESNRWPIPAITVLIAIAALVVSIIKL